MYVVTTTDPRLAGNKHVGRPTLIAVCSRVVGANDIAVELELIETAETKRSHSEAPASSPVSIQTQSLALRALRALRLDGNRASGCYTS